MAQLRDNITSEFEEIQTKWPNIHNETRAKISTMKNYYSGTHADKSEVVRKTKTDEKNLKTDFDKHDDLFSRGSSVKGDLRTQVESSENRVEKLIKYGRPAAVGFAVLGAVIGGGIGAKAPGWGQVAAIAVGVVVGFIAFAVVAIFLYFITKWKFIKRREEWKKIQRSNQEGVELVDVIKKKKSCLREIRTILKNDIEENNMASGLDALLEKMTEYVKDTAGNHGQFNQV